MLGELAQGLMGSFFFFFASHEADLSVMHAFDEFLILIG